MCSCIAQVPADTLIRRVEDRTLEGIVLIPLRGEVWPVPEDQVEAADWLPEEGVAPEGAEAVEAEVGVRLARELEVLGAVLRRVAGFGVGGTGRAAEVLAW